MNLRSCLFLSAVAVSVIVGGCNNRDPLAPYDFLNGTCANMPPGIQGMTYMYQPDFSGGVAPYTWEAVGLPPGLEIDPDTGLISGIPSEFGEYNVVIIVTDANGRRSEVACGSFEVQEADELMLECTAPPPAVQGTTYSHMPIATGGTLPLSWSATGLPATLTIDPETGEISGEVTDAVGFYPITITVTDSSDPPATAECMTELEVRPGLSVDPEPLEMLEFYPDNCVPANSGIDIDQLIADGVVVGGDGSPITCSFEAFTNPDLPPGTGFRGHGNLPLGITQNDDCTAVGTVAASEPHGMYVWIATLTQESTGQKTYVPYCAPQMVQPGGAYDISITQNGDPEAKFKPGYATMSGGAFSFGDDSPDPLVEIVEPCTNDRCFYGFFFFFNSISSDTGGIVKDPNQALPNKMGMSHPLQVFENDIIDGLRDRFWVVNTEWHYCLYGTDTPDEEAAAAENEAQCGDADLAMINGNGSLEFGVIVRPQ